MNWIIVMYWIIVFGGTIVFGSFLFFIIKYKQLSRLSKKTLMLIGVVIFPVLIFCIYFILRLDYSIKKATNIIQEENYRNHFIPYSMAAKVDKIEPDEKDIKVGISYYRYYPDTFFVSTAVRLKPLKHYYTLNINDSLVKNTGEKFLIRKTVGNLIDTFAVVDTGGRKWLGIIPY